MIPLQRFLPERLPTSYRERLRASIGACLGIAATGALSAWWMGAPSELPSLIAPIGASAVLLFGLPASPLAQPWAIIGGNTLAAIIGITVAHLMTSPIPTAAIAVAATLAAMSLLRCVHPPSGAVALTAVLGGPHITQAGYSFVLVPVLLNSVLLAAVAVAYNNLTGRSYPHRPHAPAHPHRPAMELRLSRQDIDEALTDYGEALDISRDDLETLFQELLGRAEQARQHN